MYGTRRTEEVKAVWFR